MATYSHHQFAYSYPTQLLSTNISGQTAIGNASYNNTVALGVSSSNSGHSSLSPTSVSTGIGTLSPSLSNNNNNCTQISSTVPTNLYCSCTTRSLVTDPMTGQSVCACQYEPRTTRLSLPQYSRAMGVYATTPYPSTEQNPYPSISVDSPSYFSSLNSTSNETMAHWSNTGLQPTTSYYHYDHSLAPYGYGPSYDIAARRKNASRESTNTLKSWLNEHRKNPYPTKGEKIMLAIITKMTLTQVSTWFANARRRLKKENKMTWEPKNKADDDGDAVFSDNEKDRDDLNENHKRNYINEGSKPDQNARSDEDSLTSDEDRKDVGHLMPIQQHLFQLQNPQQQLQYSHYNAIKTDLKSTNCGIPLPASKPKIWSLADTAASKTPPRSPSCLLQGKQTNTTYQEQQQPYNQHQYNQFSNLDQTSTKPEPQPWPNSKYVTQSTNNNCLLAPSSCQESFLNTFRTADTFQVHKI